MSCDIDTALRALDRGHVRWDQLHPNVRVRLQMEGVHEADVVAVFRSPPHFDVLQHGEYRRGSYPSDWRKRRTG